MERLACICLAFWVCSISFGQTPVDVRATVPMKEYIDMQASLNKELMLKLLEVQNNNINNNVEKANAAMEKRLDGMNEFRETLKDQGSTFVTRSELIAWLGFAMALVFGIKTAFFKSNGRSDGKNIVSGDKVEVKK